MPSHNVHAFIGKRICGFYNVEIDALIDFSKKNSSKDEDVEIVEEIEIPVRCLPGMVIIETDIVSKRSHDAGRTTCKVLFSQTREVLRKYGEQGVCYYILHHYLDKLEDIILGGILHQYSQVKEEESGFDIATRTLMLQLKEAVRTGLDAEVSALKALELIVDKGFRDPFTDYCSLLTYEMKLFREYKSRTRTRKSANLEALWYTCLKTLESQQDWDIAKLIATIARTVREKIVMNAEWVWCTIMKYDYLRLARSNKFGVNLIRHMMKTLNCDNVLKNPPTL
jgi:predicted DNA-binding ribbon-helix-helix protein